jgi:DHA2 family multidrug resistance protein
VFVRACSLGLCFVPLSVAALSDLRPSERGSGAGLFNVTRELGGSIGTAWMSTRLDSMTKQYYSDLAPHLDAYGAVAQEQLGAGQAGMVRAWDPVGAALSSLGGRLSLQALVRAFNQNFTLLAVVFAMSLVVVVLLKKPAPGVPVPAGH